MWFFLSSQSHRRHREIFFVCRETRTNKNRQFRFQASFQQEFPAEGLSCLRRIGISRFSIRISSLRALRLERGKRVGGEYVPTTSIITAKAFRLKAKVFNLVNGKINHLKSIVQKVSCTKNIKIIQNSGYISFVVKTFPEICGLWSRMDLKLRRAGLSVNR